MLTARPRRSNPSTARNRRSRACRSCTVAWRSLRLRSACQAGNGGTGPVATCRSMANAMSDMFSRGSARTLSVVTSSRRRAIAVTSPARPMRRYSSRSTFSTATYQRSRYLASQANCGASTSSCETSLGIGLIRPVSVMSVLTEVPGGYPLGYHHAPGVVDEFTQLSLVDGGQAYPHPVVPLVAAHRHHELLRLGGD